MYEVKIMFVHVEVLVIVLYRVHVKNMRINKKTHTGKISKGYRLKPSTHKLIDKIQAMLNANQDAVITRACKSLYKELKSTGSRKIINI